MKQKDAKFTYILCDIFLLLTVLVAGMANCDRAAEVPRAEQPHHHVNKEAFKNFELSKDVNKINYDTINRILRDENQPSYRNENNYRYKRSINGDEQPFLNDNEQSYRNENYRYFQTKIDNKPSYRNENNRKERSTNENQPSSRNVDFYRYFQPKIDNEPSYRNENYRYKRSTNAIASNLTESISNSTNCKHLNLSSHNLTHFDIFTITNLSNNSIEMAPYNNRTTTNGSLLNLNISQLSELESLDLSDNRIIELQTINFVALKNLKCLNLSKNHLTRIDKDTFSNLMRMDTLILAHNNITVIDYETFLVLPTLQHLDLSFNRLHGDAIRALQGIPDLVGLSIAYNDELGGSLQEFVASWSLKELDASGTGLCRIPAALVQSVRALRLGDNWLERINCGDLDSYPLLQYLDLSHAHITVIEDDALGRLEVLETLFLDHNQLKHVPISLPTSLEHLFLHNNEIMDIQSQTFANLRNLQILDLSGNKLLYLPALPLPKLLTLNLQSAELKGLSQSIVKTSPHLRDLLLNGNPIKCSDLLGIAEWASPCQTDRSSSVAEPTQIKETFVATQNGYFKEFALPIGADGNPRPTCAHIETKSRINNRSIKIVKRIEESIAAISRPNKTADVATNTSSARTSLLRNTTTTVSPLAGTKHVLILSQTGSDSNYVTMPNGSQEGKGLNILSFTTTTITTTTTARTKMSSESEGKKLIPSQENDEHPEGMPNATTTAATPGTKMDYSKDIVPNSKDIGNNQSDLYKIDEIHIKDRHLLGTPLLVHKGHSLVETTTIDNRTAPDLGGKVIGQGPAMRMKKPNKDKAAMENVILKTVYAKTLPLPEKEMDILATVKEDDDLQLNQSIEKKDEKGHSVEITGIDNKNNNNIGGKKDHFRLNTPIGVGVLGSQDNNNNKDIDKIANHKDVSGADGGGNDVVKPPNHHHHAINTPRIDDIAYPSGQDTTPLATTLGGNRNTTTTSTTSPSPLSISTKPEQWLDIRTAKGHPGLFIVIGVTIGVLFMLGLVQVYRCRKPSLRHHHHHLQHPHNCNNRHHQPPWAAPEEGQHHHQLPQRHPDDTAHTQHAYTDQLDIHLVGGSGGDGGCSGGMDDPPPKKCRKKYPYMSDKRCQHNHHDENDYYVEMSHECQARIQSDFLPMELLSPRRSSSPVHNVRLAMQDEPQVTSRFDVW